MGVNQDLQINNNINNNFNNKINKPSDIDQTINYNYNTQTTNQNFIYPTRNNNMNQTNNFNKTNNMLNNNHVNQINQNISIFRNNQLINNNYINRDNQMINYNMNNHMINNNIIINNNMNMNNTKKNYNMNMNNQMINNNNINMNKQIKNYNMNNQIKNYNMNMNKQILNNNSNNKIINNNINIKINLHNKDKYSDVVYYKWENGIFIQHDGPKINNCYPVTLDPLKILDFDEIPSGFELDLRFKQKLYEEKEHSSEISLAYEILNQQESIPYMKNNKDNNHHVLECNIFYCATVGDYKGILNHLFSKKSLLYTRDKFERTLLYIAARNGHYKVSEILLENGADIELHDKNGSTPLHMASYHGHEDIIKLLLSYGANIYKKNHLGEIPSDEAPTFRYKNIITSSQDDKILNLYSLLLKEKLVDRIIKVKKYNMVTKTDDFIAIKFIPSDQILPYHFKKVRKNWIPAWHGTKYNCIKSILKNGLKESGSILKDFGEIKTRDDHIQDNETFNNIQNWSKAVFTSPSLFYCIHPTYSERIDSSFFQNKYAILIEARLRPNSFQTFESTTCSRKTLVGEPLLLEYRVKSVDANNRRNIYVISITFVSENFINNAKDYDQGDILSNSEAERIVFDE